MKQNLKILDGLRGIAALYILFHHARQLLTQPYKSGLSVHPEYYNFLDKVLVYTFSIFKFGHEAVIIFFVLSGFLIHLKQADQSFDFNNFKLKIYFKKRALRIYPTLFTAMILSIIIDLVITLFLNENLSSQFSKYSTLTFLYNLFLIPNTPDWGNNYPMWSLKHEWMFYLAYPLLLWLNCKFKNLFFYVPILLYISYLIGLRIPYIENVAYTLLIWTIGALLAELYRKDRLLFNNRIPFLLLLITIYPFIDRERIDLYPYADLVFGLIVAGTLSILIQGKAPFVNEVIKKAIPLSLFSYSLYLLHWPLLTLSQKIILFLNSNELPYHYWYVLSAIITVVPLTYVIYIFSEKKAQHYKNR